MYSLDGRKSHLLKLHVHTEVLAVCRTRKFTCTVLDGRISQLLKLHVHTGVLAVYRTREFTCTCTVWTDGEVIC